VLPPVRKPKKGRQEAMAGLFGPRNEQEAKDHEARSARARLQRALLIASVKTASA